LEDVETWGLGEWATFASGRGGELRLGDWETGRLGDLETW